MIPALPVDRAVCRLPLCTAMEPVRDSNVVTWAGIGIVLGGVIVVLLLTGGC